MNPEDIAAWKARTRAEARARLTHCDPAWGEALMRHWLEQPALPQGMVVGGVWPLPGEIDLRPLLRLLHAKGHPIALPFTPPKGHPLEFRAWHPGAVMREGRFGTHHPDGEVLIPDVLLVPLLAFDRAGNRLGYGGGYYDRTLAGLPGVRAVGFGFAAQEFPALCTEPTDRPLDAIVTEREWIKPEPSI